MLDFTAETRSKFALLPAICAVAFSLTLAACGDDNETTSNDVAVGEEEGPVWAEGVAAADTYRDQNQNITEEVKTEGTRVYDEVCAACHEARVYRAPQRYLLEQMSPETIYKALTEGVMQIQTEDLSDAEKQAVSQFIPGRMFSDSEDLEPLMCEGEANNFDRNEPPVFTNWGFDLASTHFIPTETAEIDRTNVKTLTLKWAVAYPSALRARSQPALAAGAIYVGSQNGTVYALDRETGCARWTFHAAAEVRTGIVVSPWEAGDADAKPMIYFGDLIGNAYAVDAFTGEEIWRVRMDDHPSTTLTGTPSLYKDTLYVPVSSLEEGVSTDPDYLCCTFRGAVVALEADTGGEIWRSFLIDRPADVYGTDKQGDEAYGPSGAPVWNAPAIDVKRNQLYVTTGDNYSSPATERSDSIVAIDLKSGRINWVYQALENDVWNGSCEEAHQVNCPEEDGPDFDFGAGAILATASDGKDYVLAGQKSGHAWGIDADTGEKVWSNKVGRGGVVAGIHFGIAAHGDTLFVPVSDVPDGNEYDEPARPGMYALDIKTGEFIWKAPSPTDVCGDKQACYPGYSGTITATEQLLVAGSNDGMLRIYDTETGEVLWKIDTDQDFVTVDGGVAHGGSMGGGTGPLLYNGLLIMNSGYGFAGKMPGNALLVFEVE